MLSFPNLLSASLKCKCFAEVKARLITLPLIKAESAADLKYYRHKWFWDKSIQTKGRKDTYRYRVVDQATEAIILPEDEWYDPVEDDETKIKILFVGLPFQEHSK